MPQLTHDDIESLTAILEEQALANSVSMGEKGYYRNLIQQTNMPSNWKSRRIGALVGSFDLDARELLLWADNQGSNTADMRYSTLGSLLEKVLPDLGGENAQLTAAIILARKLYRDPKLAAGLQRDMNIPVKASLAPPGKAFGLAGAPPDTGPEIEWQGEADSLSLQAFLKPEPDLQDVGFLMRAIKAGASVCRVVFDNSHRVGTGFIIGENWVLTNYHVMADDPNGSVDPVVNAPHTRLQFGRVSTSSGAEAAGKEFKLDETQPIAAFSLMAELDYTLLKAEASLGFDTDLPVLPLNRQTPAKGEALNILGYPADRSLQFASSGDGIVTVIPDKGLLQYATRALGGSSGSPCFTDDWQVTALHHAERSRSFGVVREGIIMKNILAEIDKFLR